ncbi:hypothetical protein, partial [Pseudotabrizicola sp.]|uniref:hypothetical protein n=1 Tax=Pseudotabrizicola sp. TaxID=2939647 RepID=UPI00271F4215
MASRSPAAALRIRNFRHPDLICIKATNLWFSQTARRGDACFGAANRARHSFDWDATWEITQHR